jgi:hypothetical protein
MSSTAAQFVFSWHVLLLVVKWGRDINCGKKYCAQKWGIYMRSILYLHEIHIVSTWDPYCIYMRSILYLHEIHIVSTWEPYCNLHEIHIVSTWDPYCIYMRSILYLH